MENPLPRKSVWLRINEPEINIMWPDAVATVFNYLVSKKAFKPFTMPTITAPTRLTDLRN